MVIFLILRQYIGTPIHPAPIGVAVRTGKKNPRNVIGAQCLVSIACASPFFIRITYYFGFTNRKRKYFEEKTTATLKSKQTSIATVRNHLRILASSPTPLIFHWSLPLKVVGNEKLGESRGWLLLQGDTGLWRSMSVCVLI